MLDPNYIGFRIITILFIIAVVIYNLRQDYTIRKLQKQLKGVRYFVKSSAWELQMERERQINTEAHTLKEDKVHGNLGELIGASAGYLESYLNTQEMFKNHTPFKFFRGGFRIYPWKVDKREQKTQRRKLIIAGALILAELDRIKE